MATPIEIINAYIGEIQGSMDNQDAQIRLAQQTIKDAESAKQIYVSQIGALNEAAARISRA